MKQEFIIYTRMLEVTLWTFEKVNTFPKSQRFVLGQQLENSALTALRLIIEANNAWGDQAKLEKLWLLNVELEVLRSLFRIAFELKFMKASTLGYITNKVDEVGKIGGSWQKKIRGVRPAAAKKATSAS